MRSIRGFTLIELIVVILILGILAAIAVVGYTQVTDRARDTAARVQLRQLAETVLVKATLDSAPLLNRALVIEAIEESHQVEVIDALSAAAPWTLLSAAETPDAPGEVSVGFRNSDTGPLTDTPGTQAVIVIGERGSVYSQVVRVGGAGAALGEFNQAPAPEQVPIVTPFGSMWVWDNSLTTEQDNRGTGYASANPETIVAFARQQGLSRVHVGAPWVSDEGPISVWMDETTTALHDAGFEVGVLGGDPGWLDNPELAVTWALDAISTRPVDYVELSLEPWTLAAWNGDRAGTVAKWEATMDAVKAALPADVKLVLDAPYWLATTAAPDGSMLFDAVLERADEVSIVAFVDNAEGFDGVLALSSAARAAAGVAGTPYMVGLETDTPAVAGGADYTFYDEGAEALVREADLVDVALAGDPLYGGVAVEHYRAWRSLLGMS